MGFKVNSNLVIENDQDVVLANVVARYVSISNTTPVGVFQGMAYGYCAGGTLGLTTVDRIALSSGNQGGMGFVAQPIATVTEASSIRGDTAGFTAGTRQPTVGTQINKYPFSGDQPSTDVGDLDTARSSSAGTSSSTHGYAAGGYTSTPATVRTSVIEKFPFAISASTSTSVGALTQTRHCAPHGAVSGTHGYTLGGFAPPGSVATNRIDKYPFSADQDATDVSDLPAATHGVSGISSFESAYGMGGTSPAFINTYSTFPFSSEGNAVNVGTLANNKGAMATASSYWHGFVLGGALGTNSGTNIVEKFPYASEGYAIDHTDLSIARFLSGGFQE